MGSCEESVKERTPVSDTIEQSEVAGDNTDTNNTKDYRSNNSIVFNMQASRC